ncbi:MAG: trehalose-phosphatase [Burkholderiaceae bacterium]|nr:trehalose-phosphatase [Burkholderiaceae bacterium]
MAVPPLPHLLSAAGEQALARLLAGRPLLAFDFDGTLAPIVARPQDARVPVALAQRLQRLARCRPVAVVTGRRVADVRGRLGFEPSCVIGGHGAEDEQDPQASQGHALALDPARSHLQAQAASLAQAGILVEDKGQSIALHYRLAPDLEAALRTIDALLQSLRALSPGLRMFGGKRVVNLTAADAPDKAEAMLCLVQRSAADGAFFAGDDVNDEPVFRMAPSHWLTVRVGHDQLRTDARFRVGNPAELLGVIDRMLYLAGA